VTDAEKFNAGAVSPASPLVPVETVQRAAAAPFEPEDAAGKVTQPGINTCAGCLHLLPRGTCARSQARLGGVRWWAYDRAKGAGKTKLSYGQWLQVRTPQFKAWFGDWEAAQKAQVLNGEPVADLRGFDAPQGYPALRRWAIDLFNGQGGVAESPILGAVTLDARAVRDSMGHGMNPFKAEAFAAVKDVLERGVLVLSRLNDGEASHYVSAPVRIRGMDDIVTVLVRKDAKTQRMYLHSVTTKENLLRARDSSSSAADVGQGSGKVTSGEVANVVRGLLTFNPDTVSKAIDPDTGEPLVGPPPSVPSAAHRHPTDFVTSHNLGMSKHTTSARPAYTPPTRDRWAARTATAKPQAPGPVSSNSAATATVPGGQIAAEDAQRAAEPTRRPGRPAKGQRPLTDAERQAQSRRRRREAAVSVTDDLRAADDAALLAGLALRMKETQAEGEAGDTARWVAGRIVGELCRRHGIEPQGFVTVIDAGFKGSKAGVRGSDAVVTEDSVLLQKQMIQRRLAFAMQFEAERAARASVALPLPQMQNPKPKPPGGQK